MSLLKGVRLLKRWIVLVVSRKGRRMKGHCGRQD